jgi:DNA repair exonuclease SbcCD ATPase subunit
MIDVSTNLEVEECCTCGTIFGFSATLKANLKKTKETFYCPNGHPQHYIGEKEAEKLRKELHAERVKSIGFVEQISRLNKEIKRTEKRIQKGFCPKCHRHFTNLETHMHSKHPCEDGE